MKEEEVAFDYNNGEYTQSIKSYQRTDSKSPRKPRLKFRPDSGTVLDLSDIDETKPISAQLKTSLDLVNQLYFLHYALKSCRKIVCVSGAGMSVAAGIPDFRSSNGLFQGRLSLNDDQEIKDEKRRYPKRVVKPKTSVSSKQLFTSNVYSDTTLTGSFHQLVDTLYKLATETKPTLFHHFLNKVSQDGRLVRLYTQNIDCLDSTLPGLQTVTPLRKCAKNQYPKTIQLHGSIKTMCCSKCHWIADLNPMVFQDTKPRECPECQELNSVRMIVGKRTQTSGIIRPRFVLYNEFHPDGELIGQITEYDLKISKPDCLLIVGTSMKIPGVRRLVKEMSKLIKLTPSRQNTGCVVWINLEPPSAADLTFLRELDLVVVADCQKIPVLLSKLELEKVFENKSIKSLVGKKCDTLAYKISKPSKVQSRIVHDKNGKLVSFVMGKEYNIIKKNINIKKKIQNHR